ncbi:helix-turn-helix domain-containing protein [Fusobacterium polymorphum]|uniref:helix-turn-helix domain-containing protein n=1 Tax=Fusobacterium nucleatum subsp. polymorphum TaxID=76857 RepID=UPI001C6EA0D8|nr:helix-turn-helix transcriptional regulator [Fusobacterium polymorphum]QYR58922.1 helix-turn-helix transcriptional regulator [Fusobacterium polymorphum]
MPYEIKDIVKIIKNKRDELKLSLRDLSSKTGISSSTLQRYETMETYMPIDKFQIICDVLGLEADKLLSNKNYKPQENNIFSQLTEEELAKLEKFNNMSTVMFMNEGNDISDKDKRTLAIAYAEVLISQRKK